MVAQRLVYCAAGSALAGFVLLNQFKVLGGAVVLVSAGLFLGAAAANRTDSPWKQTDPRLLTAGLVFVALCAAVSGIAVIAS